MGSSVAAPAGIVSCWVHVAAPWRIKNIEKKNPGASRDRWIVASMAILPWPSCSDQHCLFLLLFLSLRSSSRWVLLVVSGCLAVLDGPGSAVQVHLLLLAWGVVDGRVHRRPAVRLPAATEWWRDWVLVRFLSFSSTKRKLLLGPARLPGHAYPMAPSTDSDRCHREQALPSPEAGTSTVFENVKVRPWHRVLGTGQS